MPPSLYPHEGEMARLCGCDVEKIHNNRRAAAENFAEEYRTVLVLKGHGTMVCGGGKAFVNPTGNPGMATGGSGDVLAGSDPTGGAKSFKLASSGHAGVVIGPIVFY